MRDILRNKILLGVVGLSAALQLSTIGKYSFWFDESYTSALLKYSPADAVALTAVDVHPPLYYLLLKLWSSVFGTGDIALRLLSTIFMLTSIVLVYVLVRKLMDKPHATAAAAIAAIGPFVIRYGQEARMYGLGSVLILGSTIALVHQMKQKAANRSRGVWVLYAVLCAAIIYTHYFGGVILLAHGLYVLQCTKKGNIIKRVKSIDRRWLFAVAGAGVLYLPWVPTLKAQLSAVNSGFWIPDVTPRAFADTLSQLLAFRSIGGDNDMVGFVLAHAGLGLLIGMGVVAWRRKWVPGKVLTLTVGSVGILSVVLYAVSALPFTSSFYYVRYFAQYTPLFYGGIGIILYAFWQRKNTRYVTGAAIVALVTTQVFGISRVLSGEGKVNNQTNEVYKVLKADYTPGDVLLAEAYGTYYDLHHYNDTDSEVMVVTPVEDYGSLEPIFRRKIPATIDAGQVTSATGRIWYLRDKTRGEQYIQPDWTPVGPPTSMGDQVLQLYRL